MVKKKRPDIPIKPETTSRRRRLTREESTAYHEAGHATAAFVLGFAVPRVFIRLDAEFGERRGQTDVCWVCDVEITEEQAKLPYVQIELDQRIKCLMGGMIAENIARGKTNLKIKLTSAFDQLAGDTDEVVSLATIRCQFGRSTTPYDRVRAAYLYWLEVSTQRLLKQNWQLVEAIATALLENHELSGTALKRIVRTVKKTQAAESLAHFDTHYGDWVLPGENASKPRLVSIWS